MSRPRTGIAPSSELYTSTQVREKLGISSSTLTVLVDKDIIRKVLPPGKKQGYYTKASVDEYARQQEAFHEAIQTMQQKHIVTRLATEKDEQAIFEMEQEVLGLTVPLETRLAWLRRNPYIDIIVSDNATVYGHLSLLPMQIGTIVRLLKGELRGWQVKEDEVLTYSDKTPYTLFVMAMAVRNNGEEIGRINASSLIREAQILLIELANKGCLVKTIYATSRTRDGIYLSNRMGMEMLTEHSSPRRMCFKLEMKTSRSKWASEYRDFVRELNLPTKETKEVL